MIVLLNLVAVVVVRNLYFSGLEAERLKTTALKYSNMVEQNQIYRQHHHDIKNHLTVVLGLLTLGKNVELKEYLDSYLIYLLVSIAWNLRYSLDNPYAHS
ncbi:MAG: Spo0B domain-containing protein [Desulfitobacterium hafniense]|nr:Spo0B domain-containing protein [Desulfitobacterium hafniense]